MFKKGQRKSMIIIDTITDILPYISKYAAIIFDLDDTLYSEKAYVKSGFHKISKMFQSSEEAYRKLWQYFEKGENAIDKLLEENRGDIELKKEELLDIYRKQKPDIELYPGVQNLLAGLKKKYKLGIITDGRPEGQQAKIEALQIEKYFDKIIITDELGGIEFRKPNPMAFCKMQKYWGVPFEQMVYIGDNLNKDFKAPIHLGMGVIFFKNKDGLYN